MAKLTKETKVSKKSNKQGICSFLKSVWNTEVFSGDINMKNLFWYSIISYVVLVIITWATSYIANPSASAMTSLLYIIIGFPLIFIFLYGLFYIFLNAFESKRKKFWESFLVFIATIIPFVIVSNLLSLISTQISSLTAVYFISLLVFVDVIYLFWNFILVFKKYYKTSGFKVITSLILVSLLIGIFELVQLLAQVLNK